MEEQIGASSRPAATDTRCFRLAGLAGVGSQGSTRYRKPRGFGVDDIHSRNHPSVATHVPAADWAVPAPLPNRVKPAVSSCQPLGGHGLCCSPGLWRGAPYSSFDFAYHPLLRPQQQTTPGSLGATHFAVGRSKADARRPPVLQCLLDAPRWKRHVTFAFHRALQPSIQQLLINRLCHERIVVGENAWYFSAMTSPSRHGRTGATSLSA